MKKLKILEEIDFFFDPKPLTKNEIEMISNFIKADKERKSRLRKSSEIKKKQHVL
jgi:hypothetical protein